MKKIFKYKKTVLIAFLVLAITGFIYTGSTLAFFQDETKVIDNKITTNQLDTEMNETGDPTNKNLEKMPYVTNTGKTDVLVRARIVISPKSEFDKYFALNGLDGVLVEGLSKESTVNWGSLDEIGNIKDGMYYYTNILEPGKSTTKLFTNVVVKTEEGGYIPFDQAEEDVKKKINGMEITVYHEAIPTIAKINGKVVNAVDINDDGKKVLNNANAKILWDYFDNNKQ